MSGVQGWNGRNDPNEQHSHSQRTQGSFQPQVQDVNNAGSNEFALHDDALSMLQRRITEMRYGGMLDPLVQATMAIQRPMEHFLTVSNNGTILGSTETITGIPPNNLLMTPV